MHTPKGRDQLRSAKKCGKQADLQRVKQGIAFLKPRKRPSVARDIVKLLKGTEFEKEQQISDEAGDKHKRHKSEIAHSYFLLKLILVFVFQKGVADDKGYQRKENVKRKRIIR